MTVNGELLIEVGTMIDPEVDDVRVDGHPARPEALHYILLNKPKGFVTTLSDPRKRPTIVQLMPDLGVMLRPVGRLDMDTEGLIICTNDGNLTDRLTHPKFGIEKEYHVIVTGDVSDKSIQRLRDGVFVQGRWTAEAYAEKLSYERRTDTSKLKLVIHEGRNRQVRLMCDSIGHPVESLERVRIGTLTDRGLARGQARRISVDELEQLYQMSGSRVERSWIVERLKASREAREAKRQARQRRYEPDHDSDVAYEADAPKAPPTE